MGQSTSGSSGNVRGQNIQQEFESLQELLGDWIVDEFVFRAPNAEPIVNLGRTTCRAAVGRLAMVVITDISTSLEQTIQLQTFDPRQNRYELALIDATSDTGIVLMIGQTLDIRASEEIRVQFGKAAMAVREWTLAPGQNLGQTGFTVERIVENKITDDRWVIQYFSRGQHGETLIKQQVLTRSNVGCQPLVGCELGCPGLPGCQEGCQGIKGLQGLQGQTQPGCACESQLTGQASMLTQPLMGTTQPLMGTTQPVLLQPPVCAQPPVCVQPPVCGLTPPVVVVVPPTCVRTPVRPPQLRGEHHK